MSHKTKKIVIALLAVVIAMPCAHLEARKWQSDTLVEYVVEVPKPQTGLGTVFYSPSEKEKPFFQKVARNEVATGGLAGDYDIRNHDAQYVGWFGIVRRITLDKEKHQTRLLMEHKYFDGLTDAHLQALSFNGSGDFEAILNGDEHQIDELQLLKIYGTVTDHKADKLPTIKVDFARDWAWGTFTFIMASGTQRGSEEWRKQNTVPLNAIYSSRPNESYYIARLGPAKTQPHRAELLATLARDAATKMGFDQKLLRNKSGKFEKCIAHAEFRARSTKSALILQPESKSFVDKIQIAIAYADDVGLQREIDLALNANMHDAVASVLAHALVLEDNNSMATSELKNLGFSLGKCVHELIEALRCENDMSRNVAAELLGEIGSDAEIAIPGLIQSLSDPDSFVRGTGAEALGYVNRKPELVLPALALGLNDADSHARYSAAGAIGAFGRDAKGVAVELARVLRDDKDIHVRWNSADALGATGNAQVAAPALMLALSDTSPIVNRFAATGLKQLGKGAINAVPKLKERLSARDPGTRIAAAEALWHIDGNSEDSLPVLQSIVNEAEFPAAMWAANALVAFGPSAKPALDSLLKATRTGNENVRTSSITAIGSIGPGAMDALQRLRELMNEKHGETRVKAATAIWRISNESKVMLDLIQDLESDQGHLSYIIEAVGEIGALAKAATPMLEKHLTNQDRFVRKAAKTALARVAGGH